MPPSSVIVYVRVITSGHVLPSLASLLVTVNNPSAVHASAIAKSPANASNPATEVAATGASLALQPSTSLAVIDPVTAGASLSVTVIVKEASVSLPDPSVAV